MAWYFGGNPLVTLFNFRAFGTPIPPSVVRLAVTVYQDGLRDGETRHSELVQAAEMLWRIGHEVLTSGNLSGTVTDRNGVVTGQWTYTPTAPN